MEESRRCNVGIVNTAQIYFLFHFPCPDCINSDCNECKASIKAGSVEEDKLTQRKGALHKGGQTCGGLLYAGTFQPNSAMFTQVVNTLVVSWLCLFSKYELLHLNREYYHTRHRWCADWPVLGLFWKQQPCSAHTWVPATATEHNSAKKIATRRRYFCTVVPLWPFNCLTNR